MIVATAGNTYIEDTWIRKCMLALIFANAFEIAKFAKLRPAINFCYVYGNTESKSE